MNEYTSKKEREHIEAQFDAFMNHSIRNCAHNVTRMVSADEKKRRCISLDTLDEDCLGECMAFDKYHFDSGITLEADFTVRITDKVAKQLLAGLTKREKQVVTLRVIFDLDYDEIGEKLRITPERARAYKYHGIKKAKEKGEEYGRD